MFCFRSILQIWIILMGLRDTSSNLLAAATAELPQAEAATAEPMQRSNQASFR